MNGKPIVAVGLGEVLWDLLPAGKQLGGAPANFAFHAQQLGARGVVVSAVGDDPLGGEIVERLRYLGLDARFVDVDSAHPTGTVSVELDRAGVPSYVIHEQVAWDFIRFGDDWQALAASASVVCFGSLAQRGPHSRVAIQSFLRATLPDTLRICDINLRQQFYSEPVIADSLHLASVLKVNDQELPIIGRLYELEGEEKIVSTLLEHLPQLRLIALTRGDRGSSLFTKEGQDHHPGVPTTLADTVGAGDAFTATLALGLLRGEPLARINAAANRVAAYVCSQHGATPKLPAELLETLWT